MGCFCIDLEVYAKKTMQKRRKIIIGVLVVLLLGGAVGGYMAYRMWNTPHEDINDQETDFKIDAMALATEFTTGAVAAEKKYSEKDVLEISGKVLEIRPGDSLTTVLLKGD